eukprot:6762954-Prymnesium_polylepis.1
MGEPVDEPVRPADAPQRDIDAPVRTADAPQSDEAGAQIAGAIRSDSAGGELPPDAVVELQDADASRSGPAGGDLPPGAIVDVHILPILPTPPSRAAVRAFIAACSVVLA